MELSPDVGINQGKINNSSLSIFIRCSHCDENQSHDHLLDKSLTT